jgi:RNA ligase (TIGR02306 family)
MSTFGVRVVPIEIGPHENADKLECAKVGGYRAVVGKGLYKTGDLVAYIPEGALCPKPLVEELGLVGKLAGPEGNRVKAVRLRGVLSQGICYPAKDGWKEGDDVTDILGVTKYEPPIPAGFGGAVYNATGRRLLRYDVENWKNFPDTFKNDETIVITEKVHGTFAIFGLMPKGLQPQDESRLVVSSKGMAWKGLAFKMDAPENEKNLYVRTAKALKLEERMDRVFWNLVGDEGNLPVFICGEIFGAGCQDLNYGANVGKNDTIGFRIFDIYVGEPGSGKFCNDPTLTSYCRDLDIPRVPVLYRGPYSKEVIEEYTSGKEAVSGKEAHMREGIVFRPIFEREDFTISPVSRSTLCCGGRVQLKNVSEEYLLRKGATEYV